MKALKCITILKLLFRFRARANESFREKSPARNNWRTTKHLINTSQ